MQYEKLSKRALKCMYTATVFAGLIILIILGIINYFRMFSTDTETGRIVSVIIVALTLFDMLVSPYFRYCRYRYRINDECIDIKEGYLFVKRHIVPIERLHKLQTAKGPIDQIFKVAKVVVTTAGGDVTIRFLDEEKAGHIAESLKERINEIVIEEREETEHERDGE